MFLNTVIINSHWNIKTDYFPTSHTPNINTLICCRWQNVCLSHSWVRRHNRRYTKTWSTRPSNSIFSLDRLMSLSPFLLSGFMLSLTKPQMFISGPSQHCKISMATFLSLLSVYCFKYHLINKRTLANFCFSSKTQPIFTLSHPQIAVFMLVTMFCLIFSITLQLLSSIHVFQ